MDKTPKKVVETIKTEAKEYYRWKSMIPRYIIIWFLLILLVVQFLLPSKDKKWVDIDTDTNILETMGSGQSIVSFLDADLDMASFEHELDLATAKILDNKNTLRVVYKKTFLNLLDLEKHFVKNAIPKDFKYLIFLSDDHIFPLNQEIVDRYNLRQDDLIDDTQNAVLIKNISMEYLNFLYKEFQDWNLVLIAYLMWSDDLKSSMMDQNQTEFEKLYIDRDILDQYIQIISYKYILENIGKHIDLGKLIPYKLLDTKTIKVGEIKDIIKRAQKEWYNLKDIKDLNPWILGNSLPKGKRELVVVR